jgi:hypothetical protein
VAAGSSRVSVVGRTHQVGSREQQSHCSVVGRTHHSRAHSPGPGRGRARGSREKSGRGSREESGAAARVSFNFFFLIFYSL